MKLVVTNDVLGEYVIRLSLTRHRPSGRLDSPRIDLWSGIPGMGIVTPPCTVQEAAFSFEADTPAGTSVTWQVRSSDSPDIFDGSWGPFVTVGRGPRAEAVMSLPAKRFCQWRALLDTDNPLRTPIIGNVILRRSVSFEEPSRRVFVIRADTVRHRYSSFDFSYERSDEPKLAILRARLGLDSLLTGTTGDFERINRVRHHVSTLWHHRSPFPEYPEWNDLDILDRRDRTGTAACASVFQVFIQSMPVTWISGPVRDGILPRIAEVYVDESANGCCGPEASSILTIRHPDRLPLNALNDGGASANTLFNPKHPLTG